MYTTVAVVLTRPSRPKHEGTNMTATAKKVIYTDADFAQMVDELGQLKANIANLQAQEKDLKAKLAASGFQAVDGQHYRASISWQEGRVSIDWRAVAEHFNPSRQLVTAHTSKWDPVVTIRVSARKTS
jgi:hypothetical protein